MVLFSRTERVSTKIGRRKINLKLLSLLDREKLKEK
jgi:hypothetical protein